MLSGVLVRFQFFHSFYREGGTDDLMGPRHESLRLPVPRQVILRLAWWPAHRPSSKHVHVQVKHRLAGSGAVVDDGAITAFPMTFIVGHSSGYTQQMSEEFLVLLRCLIERFNMFAWDHEHMCRRLGVDIPNHHAALILLNKIAGDFACDNLTKQAALFGHASQLLDLECL